MSYKVVVMLSGNGSNLQAMIDSIKEQQWDINITAVISDKPDAFGLQRAQQAGITTHAISPKSFDSKPQFNQALMDCIDSYQPDLIVLAGYMRILPSSFVNHYPNKIINIHPSLLPKYKGLDTHQRVLDAGETEHGTSIHIVTADLDDGPILAQAKLPIEAHDDASALKSKVQKLEHQLYPQTLQAIATGKIVLA
mgnify:CR=1 FL=1|tara:strand:+ start:72138 stop:72722 length:585 start_codon:yes stop_codon:yes gene_type:complete